jgi:hypothetical protein
MLSFRKRRIFSHLDISSAEMYHPVLYKAAKMYDVSIKVSMMENRTNKT